MLFLGEFQRKRGVIGLKWKPESLLKGKGGWITETGFYSISIKYLQVALQPARGLIRAVSEGDLIWNQM